MTDTKPERADRDGSPRMSTEEDEPARTYPMNREDEPVALGGDVHMNGRARDSRSRLQLIHRVRRAAIGFVRVSSVAQSQGNDSLAAQEDILRACASRRGFEIVSIAQEIGSAFRKPLSARPDLTGALRDAQMRGAVILVARADRLTRRFDTIAGINEYGVPIHIADQSRGKVGKKRLSRLVRAAEAEAVNKSTAQGSASHPSRSRSPGTLEGRKAGRAVTMARRVDNVRRVVNYALAHAEFRNLPLQARADTLNNVGIRHLNKSPDGALWTRNALRHLWPEIAANIALHEEDANWGERDEWLKLPAPW